MTLQEPSSKENVARAFDQRVGAARAAFDAGRVAEAAQLFANLARDFPSHPLPHANLGMTLRRLGKLEAAVASYQRALQLAPDNPGILSSLGNALRALGRLSEAEKLQARAVELAPRERALRYNHALTLRDMRKLNEAMRLLTALNQEDPNDAEVAWDLAITQLQLGDFAKGFQGYENRWRLARNETKLRDPPHWQGEDISGKRILLQSEQGFGDALQFARYVPLVAARGARVVLECLPELKPLFAGIDGVEQVILKGEAAPPVDLSIPLLSLARIFGTTLATIPRQVPYLRAARAGLPRRPGTRLQIGLVWAGKPTPRDRSWPLPMLAPLLEDPRLAFYSLQVGPRAADLAAAGFDRLVLDLSPHLKDFSATAEVMNALDLIVTVDTAAAHLAGALGRPVFVLLRYVSDWRWMDYRDDSPWYPTMRLFRQSRPDDFTGPVAQMRTAIARLADAATKPAASRP
ncbi:MAG TPA: tetratricopeptide repeat protein [Xanthobacteraceae bacterium]|nr:tetratricopeptide repeat protein [Xanthobacteraceae bacterium]